jgi:hypothetical protein
MLVRRISACPSWAIDADNSLHTVYWACLPNGSCAPGGVREKTRMTLTCLHCTTEVAGCGIKDAGQVYVTTPGDFAAMNGLDAAFFRASRHHHRRRHSPRRVVPGRTSDIR